MNPPTLEDYRERVSRDLVLSSREKELITKYSYHVASEKTDFSMTIREIEKILGFKDPHTIYGYKHNLLRLKYIYFTGRQGMPGANYYRLALNGKKDPEPLAVARAFERAMPGLSFMAAKWGRAGGSKPKTFSAAELARRTKRIKAALAKRWPKKRSK